MSGYQYGQHIIDGGLFGVEELLHLLHAELVHNILIGLSRQVAYKAMRQVSERARNKITGSFVNQGHFQMKNPYHSVRLRRSDITTFIEA